MPRLRSVGRTLLGLLGLLASSAAAAENPVRLALALDTSGSLGREAQSLRTRLTEDVTGALPPGSEVAVFGFNDESELLLAWTAERPRIIAAARDLSSGGRFTALHDAIFDASKYLSEGPPGRKAVLLVTDGLDENSALTLEDGVDTARELGIPIFAVGVGRVQTRVLRRIAKLTDGQYFTSGVDGSEVASRILALTPEPVTTPAAAPAEAGVSVPLAVAQEPRSSLHAGIIMLGWLLVAALTLAAFASLAYAFRRRPGGPVPAGVAGALDEVSNNDDEGGTLVTRLEGLDDGATPTMVLTLKPLLHVTRGPDSGRFFEVSLACAVSVGRADGNDVALRDPAVSSQHCRIRPGRKGGFELLDLESTNGTWVNERRVARHALAAGDSIKVGETVMQFRMDHLKG